MDENYKLGVYKMNCEDGDKYYSGKTLRKVKIRVGEHSRSLCNIKTDSNYILQKILFDFNSEVLYFMNTLPNTNFWDTVEINKFQYRGNLLNKQLELNG